MGVRRYLVEAVWPYLPAWTQGPPTLASGTSGVRAQRARSFLIPFLATPQRGLGVWSLYRRAPCK